MNKFALATLTTLCLTLDTGALAATMTQGAYKSAKEDIAAKYKSATQACQPMAGNAKDICVEEAKGRQKIARAELEADYGPSTKHSYDVRLAKADAAYAIAKEKCDDATGNAKDVCRQEATRAHTTAKADAKVVEKSADANATAREKTAAARKDAAVDKHDADYAVAKEKCDALAGDAKAGCIKDAKTRFGQM